MKAGARSRRRKRLTGRGYDRYWITEAASFLMTMWRRHPERDSPSYVVVAAQNRLTGAWVEYAFELANARRKVERFLDKHRRRDWDLFWCPNAFSRPKRSARYGLSTPFAWGDLRSADWRDFRPPPSVVWVAEPGRKEALWCWHRPESPGQAEAYSRALAHHFGGNDLGWYYHSLLRIPHTFSRTANHHQHEIHVIWFDEYCQLRRPRMGRSKACPKRKPAPPRFANPFKHGRYSVAEEYRERLSSAAYQTMRHRTVIRYHRSRTISMIIHELKHAGASMDEIAAVVWRSPYFISKHGQKLDRLKTVLSQSPRLR